jgi:hypothetical protein
MMSVRHIYLNTLAYFYIKVKCDSKKRPSLWKENEGLADYVKIVTNDS